MASTKNSAPYIVPNSGNRKAVGYIRVSTQMQAEDGLSLDAQTVAIKAYCSAHGLKLQRIYSDIESGGKDDRDGLAKALLHEAEVFVVLKFDRLSRSIKHFCQMYEDYFSAGKHLVAIREDINLNSALGRALVNILMVFAQMEREATGERTKEAITHIRNQGYHFGKVPYGYNTVPVPENERYKMLVENPTEQAMLSRIKSMVEEGVLVTKIAKILNNEKVTPPQGESWTCSLLYNLKIRRGWIEQRRVNKRNHSDVEVRARMLELRKAGHTLKQTAAILNESGYLPYKAKAFTECNVLRLLGNVQIKKILTAKEYCEEQRRNMPKPSLRKLAEVMSRSGYLTPRGNPNWWPPQITGLLDGDFDEYYKAGCAHGSVSSPCYADTHTSS